MRLISNLSEASHQITSASEQISASGQSLAEGASEQAVSIEETSSSASEEQSRAIDHISKAVAEMDKVTQHNAATAEESASAAEEMTAQAREMAFIVDDLLALTGGGASEGKTANREGNGREMPFQSRSGSEPAGRHAVQTATDRAGNRGVFHGLRKKHSEISPDEVLQMEEDFKSF